jgi:hypothetical protein
MFWRDTYRRQKPFLRLNYRLGLELSIVLS